MTKNSKIALATLFSFLAIVLYSSIAKAAIYEFDGYAWSSNIGWISMNENGNKVTVDDDGAMSGWAWSSNIGWISFNLDTGCPETGCTTSPTINIEERTMSGWARACAGTVNGDCNSASRTDGWEGWIKLDGITIDTVKNSNGKYSLLGFAWGGNVIGWIDVSGVAVDLPVKDTSVPSLAFNSTSYCVVKGAKPTLEWRPRNVTECSASLGWNGSKDASDGDYSESVSPITSETTYGLQCKNTVAEPKTETQLMTVTVGICRPDFQMTASPSTLQIVKGTGVEGIVSKNERVKVTIYWQNDFEEDIDLSAYPASIGGKTATLTFYDKAVGGSAISTLSYKQSEKIQYAYLEIKTSEVPDKGEYTITISADGGSTVSIKTKDIKITTEKKRSLPFYIEF